MKKLPMQSRIIVALAALSFTVALLLVTKYNLFPSALSAHAIPRAPINLTAVPLETINKQIQITRTGSAESSKLVPINAGMSGRVSELYVTEGQAVKAGQPLLKLEASAELPATQTAGTPPSSQANYDKALAEFNRYQKLFDIGAVSRRQLDNAAARLQEAKASLGSTPDSMPSASTTVNSSATITAPINGIVTGLAATSGKVVQTGQQLLSLGSGQEVEVVVPLSQNDLYLVHLGTPATLEVSAQAIAGQVSAVYPQVDANQVSAFLAHVKLANNPSGLLKSGMSVTVHINTGESAIVTAVPTTSVFQDNQGRYFIYLAVDGKAKLQQIIPGDSIGEFTEINSKLPEQSMVITSNINDIKDGDAITVMPNKTN